jgi:hypothetical protein
MSPVATLVQRSTRFVLLVALPNGHQADLVADALAARITTLPAALTRTLTWDQGHEMAEHVRFTTGTDVYFCQACRCAFAYCPAPALLPDCCARLTLASSFDVGSKPGLPKPRSVGARNHAAPALTSAKVMATPPIIHHMRVPLEDVLEHATRRFLSERRNADTPRHVSSVGRLSGMSGW